MESSDDSFVWTNASSAGDESFFESERESNEERMNERHIESESEKKFKKKLHKKLFKTESEVKHELLDGYRVKHESDSDFPTPATPKKQKRKRECTPSSNAEADSTHEYLEARVKQEHHTAHTYSSEEKHKKSKLEHSTVPCENTNFSQDSSEVDSSTHKIKKKKSKKERERQDKSSEMIIEDKFSAEETMVETRLERNSTISMDVEEVESQKENKKKERKKKKRRSHDSVHDALKTEILIQKDASENYEEVNALKDYEEETINHSAKSKRLQLQVSKISDRIQFEDGEDLIAACNEVNDNSKRVQSPKLRQFLKVNPYLHTLQFKADSNSFISQDDDIWLFHYPHEIDVLSLKDSDLSLDNKCKFKFDNQTFVGNVENEIRTAAFLTCENNKCVIKSLKLLGMTFFHKRIPKPQFIEENIIVNNQTDFIPLPDTKLRHPLFGSDYKKAIKVPSKIKSRLQNSLLEPPLNPKDKKKSKKRKYEEIDVGEDVIDGRVDVGEGGTSGSREPRASTEQLQSDCDPDQPLKKKAKRIKHKLQSPDTWDSEKAIEENLFNF